jgi:hypothetical protein
MKKDDAKRKAKRKIDVGTDMKTYKGVVVINDRSLDGSR